MHAPFQIAFAHDLVHVKKMLSRVNRKTGKVELQIREFPVKVESIPDFTTAHLHGRNCIANNLVTQPDGKVKIEPCGRRAASDLPHGWLCKKHYSEAGNVYEARHYNDEPERIAAIIANDAEEIIAQELQPLGRYGRRWTLDPSDDDVS